METREEMEARWARDAERKARLDAGGYAGLIVAVESFYNDGLTDYSVYAWNPETLEVEYVGGYGDWCPRHVVVDGPAWVVAMYNLAKAVEKAEVARRKAEDKARYEADCEAGRPARGKLVEVVRGRKVKKGTVGTVFWCGEGQYGWRVGLEMADGTREFTAAGNVEVIEGPTMPLANAGRRAA